MKNNIFTRSCWASVKSELLWNYVNRSSLLYSSFSYTIAFSTIHNLAVNLSGARDVSISFALYVHDLQQVLIAKGADRDGVDTDLLKLFLLLYSDDITFFENASVLENADYFNNYSKAIYLSIKYLFFPLCLKC